jgi:GNAT superfamily N-acetyltransferase
MTTTLTIRHVVDGDFAAWLPLWDGYNAFYGRAGPTALPRSITDVTWQRFLDPAEAMYALIACDEGSAVGLVHYLYHRSTTRTEGVCYLQDLFTSPASRGQGIGRRLIEAVYEQARNAGVVRVYWQTQTTNAAGRALYDRVAQHLSFIVYSHDVRG